MNDLSVQQASELLALQEDNNQNPVIIKKSNPYDTEESCLSLLGGPRKCKRFKSIKVQYLTLDFKVRIKTFEGFEAQIIQHELDHLEGILI